MNSMVIKSQILSAADISAPTKHSFTSDKSKWSTILKEEVVRQMYFDMKYWYPGQPGVLAKDKIER